MGKYFVMSNRFNKQSALDFGLFESDNGLAVNPVDGSLWKKDRLFDFGWGAENGYYRVPLPDFSKLIDMVLSEDNDEDVYGAAAIIERQYSEELLTYCESIVHDSEKSRDFERISLVFHLSYPVNRCPINGKTHEEIHADSERWKRISEYTANSKSENQCFFKKLFSNHNDSN